MNDPKKQMSVAEFREQGFLQELNRMCLHPLGLALEVIIDNETGKEYFGGIWDYRDDLEGIAFDSEVIDVEKALKVRVTAIKMAARRFKRFGWIEQPLPPQF